MRLRAYQRHRPDGRPRHLAAAAASFIAIREESGSVSSINKQNSVGGDREVAGASAAGAPGDATARTPDA
jgi:hypothetical protein